MTSFPCRRALRPKARAPIPISTHLCFECSETVRSGPWKLGSASVPTATPISSGNFSALHRTQTALHDACGCRPLQGVAPPYGRLGQCSRGTLGSRRFHRLRKPTYRSAGSMLLAMRAHSACPLPIPKCRSTVVTTLPAPPSALPLVYSDISNCQPMAVTTVVGNLDAGNLAAAVSARERNDERAIGRNRAPATICNGLHRYATER